MAAANFLPVREVTDVLDAVVADTTVVVGVGEAAHFVAEFNALRARLVQTLVERYRVSHIALEVGLDEAAPIEAWFQGHDRRGLESLVGPLTFALYGSFLAELRSALGPASSPIRIVGVDLPNSLTLGPSLRPLAELVEQLDPDAAELARTARHHGAAITGSSAAASAFSWLQLQPSQQDALTATLARLGARIEALEPLYTMGRGQEQWLEATRLARMAVTTDHMLRVMAELFSGTGRTADSTLRERFIVRELLAATERLPEGSRVAYVAHNNHIQKTPVRFYGALAAFPAGFFLARSLGDRYVSIALTHLGEDVPEMSVPAPGPLGFEVKRVAVEPPGANSIEAAAQPHATGDGIISALPLRDAATADPILTMRSQSAVSEAPFAGSFDAAFVCPRATLDPRVEGIMESTSATPADS